MECKVKHDANLREPKKKEKKQSQKVKKEIKIAAELEAYKLKKSRSNSNDLTETTLGAENFVLEPDKVDASTKAESS